MLDFANRSPAADFHQIDGAELAAQFQPFPVLDDGVGGGEIFQRPIACLHADLYTTQRAAAN